MTVTVKNSNHLVVPESVQRQAGIKAGDRVEFKVSARTITITATRQRTYTPTKAEAAAIRKGRASIQRGEFVTLDELLHDLDHPRRKTSPKGAAKSPR